MEEEEGINLLIAQLVVHPTVDRGVPRSIRGEENNFGVFISHPSKIKEMNNYINKKEKKQNEVIVSDSFKN